MPVEIRVPTLGESVVDAIVSKWLKKEGDTVAEGDALVELETDKVNVEVPAEQSGVLSQIVKQEGETVGIGEVLATIVEGDGTGVAQPETPDTTAAPATESGNGSTGSTEQETKDTPAQSPPIPVVAEAPTAKPQDEERSETPITPVARNMASENALDVRHVVGTGPGGRVTKEDVVKALDSTSRPATVAPAAPATVAPTTVAPAAPAKEPAPPARPAAQAAPQQVDAREERVRMSRRRLTIARRLVEAQQVAAMLTTFNEIDMTNVMDLRKRRRDSFKERHGVGLGFMSFFTKAVIGALKAFPLLNAEIQGEEIVIKHYYDMGIAVSTDEGLVVPVLRDADRKSFAAIESGIAELAKRAREGGLTIPELQGGTFTITNGGVFGSLLSTPILNTPQVGILGLHKIEERPIALDGQVVIRPMMYVALSYDHRIVDGSEAVRFLVRIKELVEDPETLLLEG